MGRHHLFAISAPIFWSISGITVRFMEGATAWQINFYRSSSLAVFVFVFLALRYGTGVHRMLKESGSIAIFAGLILSGGVWQQSIRGLLSGQLEWQGGFGGAERGLLF